MYTNDFFFAKTFRSLLTLKHANRITQNARYGILSNYLRNSLDVFMTYMSANSWLTQNWVASSKSLADLASGSHSNSWRLIFGKAIKDY